MEKISSFNKKYVCELLEAIDSINPILVQAFINVYGEKHRDYIIRTINNLLYILFIPKNYFLMFKDVKGVRKHDRYIMNYYLKYLRELDVKRRKLREEEVEEFVCKNYIADASFYLEDLVHFEVSDIVLSDDASLNFRVADCSDGRLSLKIVNLPIFCSFLWAIVHEFNHALCIDAIAETEDFLVTSNLFWSKAAEEVTCDYIVEMVIAEFKKLGGVEPKCLRRVPASSSYIKHDYIVIYLFNLLGPLILESLITRNRNLFIGFVGQENYDRFNVLAQDLYDNGYQEEKFNQLLDVVDRMYENLNNEDIPDYQDMLKSIEETGVKLRRINSKV